MHRYRGVSEYQQDAKGTQDFQKRSKNSQKSYPRSKKFPEFTRFIVDEYIES
jgi:hypothetical protein